MSTPSIGHPTPRLLAVVTTHDRYDHVDDATGLWLGELSHFWCEVARRGYTLDVASPRGGRVPIDPRSLRRTAGGWRANRRMLGDARMAGLLLTSPRLGEIAPSDYDGVYLAGGHGAMWDFRGDALLAGLVAAIDRQGGVVAAVCHGVAGLLDATTAGGRPFVHGRVVTGYANVEERLVRRTRHVPYVLEDELLRHGARYRRAAVPFAPHIEVDGRLVTGQNPYSALGVARAVLRLLDVLPR